MRLLCSILALGVLLAACGGDDDDVASADSSDTTADVTDTTTTTVPDGENPLVGRTFLSESATESGQPRPLVEGTQVELGFTTDGRITAQAGCNQMGGDVAVRADKLVVGELSTTLIGCPPENAAQDDWLSAVLRSSPTYTLDGDRLRIEGNGSVIELVDRDVADPARPLQGTVWQVDGLIEGDSIASIPPGVVGTVVFGEDGRVQVTVCNQGSGPFTAGQAELEVGPLALTRMACEPDVMDVENAVASVLDGTVAYTIQGPTLTLTRSDGTGLTLRAQ